MSSYGMGWLQVRSKYIKWLLISLKTSKVVLEIVKRQRKTGRKEDIFVADEKEWKVIKRKTIQGKEAQVIAWKKGCLE